MLACLTGSRREEFELLLRWQSQSHSRLGSDSGVVKVVVGRQAWAARSFEDQHGLSFELGRHGLEVQRRLLTWTADGRALVYVSHPYRIPLKLLDDFGGLSGLRSVAGRLMEGLVEGRHRLPG